MHALLVLNTIKCVSTSISCHFPANKNFLPHDTQLYTFLLMHGYRPKHSLLEGLQAHCPVTVSNQELDSGKAWEQGYLK